MRRGRIVLAFLLALILCACAGVTIALAAAGDNGGGLFEEEYLYGSVVEVPQAELSSGGESRTVSGVTTRPDGTVTNKTQIVLDSIGRYEVKYSAVLGGKYVEQKESFTVYKDAYSLSNKNSTAEYGRHALAETKNGIMVNMRSDDVFRYERMIDLSDNGPEDNVISLFITPSEIGRNDFNRLQITLTDAHDADNYVTVDYYSYKDFGEGWGCHAKACATGQTLTGVAPDTGRVWSGETPYGQYNLFSFSGEYSPDKGGKIEDDVLELRFDNDEKIVYSKNYHPFAVDGWDFVVDLDDPQYFRSLWGGFTTGEVYVSVRVADALSETASFVITEIDGQDIADRKVVDAAAPRISVDFAGYEESDLPSAKIGQPYKVFSASAFDDYAGEVSVKTNVYFAYASSQKISVDCANGTFTPKEEGLYTIEYTATDGGGNTAVKTVTVEARGNVAAIEAVGPSGAVLEGYVGQGIPLGEVSFSGGEGNISVTKSVRSGSEEIEIVNGRFTPVREGTYTVSVTGTDYIGQTKTVSYDVEITLSGYAVIDDDILMPKYLIAGSSNVLPAVSAKVYNADGTFTETATKITFTDETGEHEANGTTVVPTYTNDGIVTVKYSSETAAGVYTVIKEVPCVAVKNGNALQLSKYFVLDGMQYAEGETTAVSSVFYTDRDGAKMTFANPLLMSPLVMEIGVDPTRSRYDKIEILFTDSENESEKIKLTLERGSGGSGTSYVYVNDSATRYQLSGSFSGGTFTITYNNILSKFIFDVNNRINVTQTLDGEPFSGFSSGTAYMQISLAETYGDAGIVITRINSQTFGSLTSDRIAPSVLVYGDRGGMYALGASVTLPKARAVDVLDPYTTLSVTVRDPARQIMTASDGTKLEDAEAFREYGITLDSYGIYTISYEGADSSGNIVRYNYTLRVIERTKPEIVLSGNMPASGSVNSVIQLPEAAATDSAGGELAVTVCYRDPLGSLKPVSDFRFTPAVSGEYTVYYLAVDASGNFASASYTVNVK